MSCLTESDLISLPDYVHGRPWAGLQLSLAQDLDGVEPTPAGELLRVEMVFSRAGEVFLLDSAGEAPAFSITSAPDWTAEVVDLPAFLPSVGVWDWVLYIYDDTSAAPYLAGRGDIRVI